MQSDPSRGLVVSALGELSSNRCEVLMAGRHAILLGGTTRCGGAHVRGYTQPATPKGPPFAHIHHFALVNVPKPARLQATFEQIA
mmetsp:Transcript_23978/g.73440  ORF Transcript_23978/g.73440 Transcript_23978/m.73440 type:complete len:85 (+) Transcript_23978:1357-1611(+)|eukprot:scaffold116389_cov36-Tisochrysis_lutea.AAC.1